MTGGSASASKGNFLFQKINFFGVVLDGQSTSLSQMRMGKKLTS